MTCNQSLDSQRPEITLVIPCKSYKNISSKNKLGSIPSQPCQTAISSSSLLRNYCSPNYLVRGPKQMTCHKVCSSNMTVSPHIAHRTRVVALISPWTSELCTLFFDLLKQHLGGCQTAISTVVVKWKGLFVNSCECKKPDLYHDWMFKLICRWNKCVNVPKDYAEN